MQSVKCPTCRVSVWVPAIDSAAATEPGTWISGDDLPELPWTYGDVCPTCTGARFRTPRGDVMWCPTCKVDGLPATVVERIASKTTRTAPPPPTDEDVRQFEALKARDVELLRIRELIEWLDPDDWDDANDSAAAAGWGAYFVKLRQQIADARNTDELSDLVDAYNTAENHPQLEALEENRRDTESADLDTEPEAELAGEPETLAITDGSEYVDIDEEGEEEQGSPYSKGQHKADQIISLLERVTGPTKRERELTRNGKCRYCNLPATRVFETEGEPAQRQLLTHFFQQYEIRACNRWGCGRKASKEIVALGYSPKSTASVGW